MKHQEEGVWAVVAALPEEVGPLRRRLCDSRPLRLRTGKVRLGRLDGRKVAIAVTGDGARLAGEAASEFLEQIEPRRLIAIGIAGGLSPDLEVGAVVVARQLSDAGGPLPTPDPTLLAKAADLRGVVVGTVFSHGEIAIDPVAKEKVWKMTKRAPSSVVDLESASYARAAAAHGVPCLVMRAVSDSYEEALPLDFNRFRRPDGGSDRGRVLRYTLRHPSIVPELMQLRERMRHCAERLAALVEEIVAP